MLAGCLREEGDVEDALRLYEARRSDRTAQIIRQSRRISRIAQLEKPLLCYLRDTVLKAIPSRVQLRQIEPVVGYEA